VGWNVDQGTRSKFRVTCHTVITSRRLLTPHFLGDSGVGVDYDSKNGSFRSISFLVKSLHVLLSCLVYPVLGKCNAEYLEFLKSLDRGRIAFRYISSHQFFGY